jgi:hypothetical protein
MPRVRMSPAWLAGLTCDGAAEYIDAIQPGLALRIRRGQMVWFVRYLFDGSARRNAVLPDDVNIHDIRRTVADALLNRIGAPPWIVDHVVLRHARPKLLRTYMPTLPLGEARDALERWGRELAAILEPGSGLRPPCPLECGGAVDPKRRCDIPGSTVFSEHERQGAKRLDESPALLQLWVIGSICRRSYRVVESHQLAQPILERRWVEIQRHQRQDRDAVAL